MTRFLIVAASIVSFVGAAFAADLPTRQPPPPPSPLPVGKAPIGKGPVGKGPVAGPITTRG